MRKSRKVVKLTPSIIRRIINEERRALRLRETLEQGKEEAEKVDAEEKDAGDYAGSLEKDLDHLKALKISEARIVESLKKIRGKKASLIKKLSK